MKKRFDFMVGAFAALGLGVLILDGKTAISGAREGVQLCLNTLIPTLLPFFFLTNILSSGLMGRPIPILRPIGRLCRIPEGAEYILITGVLGGYPLGAQAISHACEMGSLSRRDGRRMLAFCNNCGPAFLFGMGGALFQDPKIPWMLFCIHILSALSVACIVPGEPGRCLVGIGKRPSAVQALWQALRSMAGVCGWVILFRVLIAVVNRWVLWYFPEEVAVIISGIVELSNGCINLGDIKAPPLRFVLCSGFLAFGGLCVAMQTYASAPNVDRDLYFPGKVLQSAISIFLSCLLWESNWAVFPGVVAAGVGIFLRKWEIRCRNSQKLVV